VTEFYKLHNRIKRFDWGSADFIPRLLGVEGDGPWAEMWMGIHPGSSSTVSDTVSLGELITGDPCRFLGEKTARQYGSLPFLFKLLAAEKPLSVQAHPDKIKAREGFERENKAGLRLDSPNRNYRDPNHKPEIICALTPLTGLCGFRDPAEIHKNLEFFLSCGDRGLLSEGFAPLLTALQKPDTAAPLRDFLSALFGMPEPIRKALTEYILSKNMEQNSNYLNNNSAPREPRTSGSMVRRLCEKKIEIGLLQNFARLYPGDPSVLAPLYLNVFRLEPGEAVFLESGVLHTYVYGLGLELMANSDNVLRGGLTSKHIDVPELMKILNFSPIKPCIIKPEPGSTRFTYPVPCGEFSLTVIHGKEGGGGVFAPDGPVICIVTDGEVTVQGSTSIVLKRGESVFIPPAADGKPFLLRGNFTLYVAGVNTSWKVP